MSDFKLVSVFPTGIGQAEFYDIDYVNTLKSEILEEYRKDEDFAKRQGMGVHTFSDNHNFWQSDPLLHTREFVSKLHDFANENVANYMDKLGYIYEEFYTTQCWANVYEKAGSIHEHYHPNSFLSWVFFVSGQDSPLYFQENYPSMIQPELKFPTPENSQRLGWTPKSGLFVIWPSYLIHYSAPNKNDEERITISGNIMLSGKVGSYEDLSYVRTGLGDAYSSKVQALKDSGASDYDLNQLKWRTRYKWNRDK